jgi:hypothetical protein
MYFLCLVSLALYNVFKFYVVDYISNFSFLLLSSVDVGVQGIQGYCEDCPNLPWTAQKHDNQF